MTVFEKFIRMYCDMSVYRGRHFSVTHAQEADGERVSVAEHNGQMGKSFAFIGKALELRLSRRELAAAKAGGGLEHVLRTLGHEFDTWADNNDGQVERRKHERLPWQLFSAYV